MTPHMEITINSQVKWKRLLVANLSGVHKLTVVVENSPELNSSWTENARTLVNNAEQLRELELLLHGEDRVTMQDAMLGVAQALRLDLAAPSLVHVDITCKVVRELTEAADVINWRQNVDHMASWSRLSHHRLTWVLSMLPIRSSNPFALPDKNTT